MTGSIDDAHPSFSDACFEPVPTRYDFPQCGVIAFSGMGSDGTAAAAYVRRQGGLIWTQSADSCASASMPDSLREGGYSDFSGDPRELAAKLVEHLAAQCS